MLGNKDKKAGGENRGPVMVRSCGTAFGKAFCCGLRCEADGGGTAAAAATTTKRGAQRRPAVLARALKTKAFLSVNADAIRDKSDWEPVIAALRGDSGNVALQVVSRSGPYRKWHTNLDFVLAARRIPAASLPSAESETRVQRRRSRRFRSACDRRKRQSHARLRTVATGRFDRRREADRHRDCRHRPFPADARHTLPALSPALKSVDTLRTLNFAACRLTARGAETLARSLMARAARRRDALWKAGVRGLTAAAAAAEDIYRINLCENAIGDEGAEHIARVAGNNESLRGMRARAETPGRVKEAKKKK
ncbi:MAG: hypothetical protein BJ554DRAFT_6525 [Olpidium bornovanus]|uniref:Uncharacterized protein n=1 Tax=Olpidium bornovanus TaxID=278681 RepID=A0A8H7ZXX2_9FUNG|nr:MAG: hypothetical protein BJ554DRAFT_6525 [Olpidium bornovanus]